MWPKWKETSPQAAGEHSTCQAASSRKHSGLDFFGGMAQSACSPEALLWPGRGPAQCHRPSEPACSPASSFSPRKHPWYFRGDDVTVWLQEHLHGLGEVRAAGGAQGTRMSLGEGTCLYRGGGRRGCAPFGICEIWALGRGISQGKPLGLGRLSLVERLPEAWQMATWSWKPVEGPVGVLVGAGEFCVAEGEWGEDIALPQDPTLVLRHQLGARVL